MQNAGMPLQTSEAVRLADSEMHKALVFAVAVTMFFAGVMLVSLMFGVAVMPERPWLAPLIEGFVGAVLGAMVLLLGFFRTRRHHSDAIDPWRARMLAETARIQAETALLQKQLRDPPAPVPAHPVTTGVAQPELIDGFELRDLEALCRAWALGAKWTEKLMVGFRMPYTHEVLSKERYYALMELMVGRGIIGGRGGDGNPTGKLLILDPELMIKRLSNRAPVPDSPTLSGGGGAGASV